MATINVDNNRTNNTPTFTSDPLIQDESSGTQTGTDPTNVNDGNEVDLTLNSGNLVSAAFSTAFLNFLNAPNRLTATQKQFVVDNDAAVSNPNFITATPGANETISDLFFQINSNSPNGLISTVKTLNPAESLYLHIDSNNNFAYVTTASDNTGRIVAAFALVSETVNAQTGVYTAGVITTTFEPLFHNDPAAPDEPINWTDVLQVGASASVSFNFDNLKSGAFLWAAVGTSASGILVTGRDLNVQDSGNKLGEYIPGGSDDPSDAVNTSQGGLGATIGINSQHFTDANGGQGTRVDGQTGVFTLVKNYVPLTNAAQATGINVNDIDYGGYINAPDAKIFLSQVTGSSSIGGSVKITLWEAGGGDAGTPIDHAVGDLLPEEKYGSGELAYIGNQDSDSNLNDDWAVPVASVTIQREGVANPFTWTSANSGTTQGGNLKVTISGNSIVIQGLQSHDTIGFAAANDPNSLIDGTFNRFDVQALANSNPVDIGRIDLSQGLPLSVSVGDHLFVEDSAPSLSGTDITHAVGEDAMTGVAGGDLSTGNPDSGDAKTDEVSYTYAEIAGLVNAGTDSPALSSLTSSFAANTAVRDIDNNIVTSNGETVFWGVLSGVVQGITATSRVVFTITNNVANSRYDVDLKDQIDHPNASGDEANLTLNLTPAFQATDKDLDPVTLTGNLVKLDVENDVPIQNNNLVSGTVDEDGVIENVAVGTQTGDGIAGGPAGAGSFADVAGQDVIATGSIASLFTAGADEPLTYSLSTTTSGLPSLFSGGVAVLYSVTGNTLTAYRTGGNPATQTDQVFIFSITNTSTGAYSFTLIDQLDHASLDGLGAAGGDNLENDLLIQLGSILRATDKDGDTITYVPTGNTNGLVITVDDDTPTQNDTLVGSTVDEDGVVEDSATGTQTGDGIAGGPAGAGSFADVAGEAVTQTGSIAALFNSGADEALTYGISSTTSGLPSLFSGGVAVLYSVTGNVLTAYRTGGNPATQTDQVFQFSITNTSTGAYSFTLIDQLDHPTLDGLGAAGGDNLENDLLIQLGSILQATDKDGDTITYVPTGNTNGLVITVDDDTPTQNNALLSGTVDEDGVIENVAAGLQNGDGIAGGPAGAGSFADVAGEAVMVTGSISGLFNSGADEALTYGISATTSGLPSLFSGGVAVLYSVTGNVLTAYRTGGNPATQTDQVFQFSITNTSTGAYNFTLIDQLDHASLDGVAGDNLENDLLIQLGSILQATDKDGDTITYVPAGDNSNGLVITVDDDTPTAIANAVATHEVQEDALTGGNTPDTGDNETKSVTATYTSADLNSLVNSGADADMSFSLNTAASGTLGAVIGTNVVTTGDVAVLSGGVNVTWAAGTVAGTLRGITTVSGVVTTIFTLAPSGSDFVFTLADQVDHSGAENDQENLGIDLTRAFLGADYDHDSVAFNADSIVMNVENDLPKFSAQIASDTIDWVDENSTQSSLNGSVGADATATYKIDKYTDLAGYTESLSGDGKTLSYIKDGKTFFLLELSDTANNGAGGYTFTVKEPPPPQFIEFNFDNLASGNFLWVAVGGTTPGGTSSTGLLVTGSRLNLNADGTGVSGGKLASDQVNTSQGGTGATIGIDNQMFTPGDSGIFTFVKDYVPLTGLTQATGQDIDQIAYTGYANVNSGSLFISQKQGNTKLDLTMSILEAGTGSSGNGAQVDEEGSSYASGGNISGSGNQAVLNKSLTFLDDYKPNLLSVDVRDGNNVLVGTWTTDAAAANASANDKIYLSGFKITSGTYNGVQVTITNNSADINGVDAFYSMQLNAVAGETFNRIELQADTGKFDIGKFVLNEGQDTPDINLDFSVSIEDKDADLYRGLDTTYDDFHIRVDGTGQFNDPMNIDPSPFQSSYDLI